MIQMITMETNIKMPEGIALLAIEKIKPYQNNARTHSDTQVEKIAASILEFGFTNPILIDENHQVIAGHGRLMAANSLGLTEVPIIMLSHLNDDQKKAYCLADNSIALDAGWDQDLLKAELISLKHHKFDLALTGFSEDELDKFFETPAPKKKKEAPAKVDPEEISEPKRTIASPSALDKKETGVPVESNPEIPTHKLPADKAPEQKNALPLAPRVKPISRVGDVWLLGKHEIKCASVRDTHLDEAILVWQEKSGRDAKLKKNKKTFTDVGIERNEKRK